MNDFGEVLGHGRGRKTIIKDEKVKSIIRRLGEGAPVFLADKIIRQDTLVLYPELRRARALRQMEIIDKDLMSISTAAGLLPSVDQGGLLYLRDRLMHRWDGNWQSRESLLFASPLLNTKTYCQEKIQGGGNAWQPLSLSDWETKPRKRCQSCEKLFTQEELDNNNLDYQKLRSKVTPLLENQLWPTGKQMMTCADVPSKILLERVLHPLDSFELSKSSHVEEAWETLLDFLISGDQKFSNESVSSEARKILLCAEQNN